MPNRSRFSPATRRQLLGAGLAGLCLGGASPIPAFGQAAARLAAAGQPEGRILVVVELSGGNDGLNTLAPFADDTYYQLRPKLGLRKKELRVIDDRYGFSGGMSGFERLFKDGRLAAVHGCGYANPSFSHFTSMAYWHTAAPNHGEEYGWVGRLADALAPAAPANYLVNIGASQSLAVRSHRHVPVVFDDPERFTQEKFYSEREILASVTAESSPNASRQFLIDTARSARSSSALVQQAWSKYRTPVDYGIIGLDLPKVAALIDAGLPTRLYYTSYRNNAFDTHVFQADTHKRLLTYASDAVAGFLKDMERIGRADDVVVLVFSEFGRRAAENVNLGTDHGTANLMFVAGKPVKGGHYGAPPDLTKLDATGNLAHTTDFRQVYATLITGWLGLRETRAVLGADFSPLPMFGTNA